jgi:spore maturation protein CgeB
MRIAFFGSSLVSAYWNGAATYYRGIIRALAELGHRVTFYEPDAFDRQRHRDIPDPSWAEVVVYQATESEACRAVDQARGADVIVKASGVGVFDDLLEGAIAAARRPGTMTIYWDVDAPATLERLRLDADDPLRFLLGEFDLVLTYGGGPPVISAFRELGARDCIPVYNALDPDTHYPVPAEPRFAADLTFIGNRLPDRESRVEEFFLRAASALPERLFMLGGSGWGDKAMPANVRYLGHIYTGDHNVINCSAMAVLNINRDSMAQCGYSPPTRVFEAAGAGACLITDRWTGIEQFLEPGREVLTAGDGGEVAMILRNLTTDRAAVIGTAARRRLLAEHTYAQRARQIDAVFAGRNSQRAGGGA